MKKQTLTLLMSLLMLSPYLSVSAQNENETHRNCATQHIHQLNLADDEDYQERRESIERHIQTYLRNTPSVSQRAIITIPIVVHVLFNSADQNISDAQIQTQIDVLNRDFRRLNTDKNQTPTEFAAVAADCEIEFCLARRKPDGTATNGIERLQCANAAWSANDDMKRPSKGGLATWDGSRYLNIWVCSLQGQLGYASFPGAPLSTDGVVIDYRYFGTVNTRTPFHLGRTTTHEIGHWLNLYHIWGDAACGEDYCSDTPTHQGPNYGCPTHPYVRTGCSQSTNQMFMNFMDYTNDACMNTFTRTQKARMQALFVVGGARRSIVENNICAAPQPVCTAPSSIQISNVQQTSAVVNWSVSNGAYFYKIELKKLTDAAWTLMANSIANSLTINNLQANTEYQVRVKTLCSNGTESLPSAPASFKTSPIIIVQPPVCTDLFEPNNSRLSAKTIRNNTTTEGAIGDSRDRDWYALKASVGKPLNIRLSNLGGDYDLRLFDQNGYLLAASESVGLLDERIQFVVQSGQDSFFILIYGYNGAFNAQKCYALSIGNAASSLYKNDVGRTPSANMRQKAADTEGVKIYPNPSSGGLTVELNDALEGRATVQIFNPTGQIVLSEQAWISEKNNTLKLNVAPLPTGFYFVKVVQNGQVWTKKIMRL